MGKLDVGAPFRSQVQTIESDWIDYNGHLNMAFYNVLFDRCVDEAFLVMGLGPDYVQERTASFFTAEVHICYVRELHLEDPVIATFQLLEYDEKRIRAYQELHHAKDGWLAATSEHISLHVDMDQKRVAPFPPDIMEQIDIFHQAQKEMPWPQSAGRSIAIKQQ